VEPPGGAERGWRRRGGAAMTLKERKRITSLSVKGPASYNI